MPSALPGSNLLDAQRAVAPFDGARLRAWRIWPGALLACMTSSCIPTIKSVFIDMSYPAEPPASAPRNVARSVDAAVSPTLLVGYEHPREMGACLGELARDKTGLAALWSYGQCVAGGGARATCAARLPFIEPGRAGSGASPLSLHFKCSAPPTTEQDRLALALALDDAAVALVGYELSAGGPPAIHGPLLPVLETSLAQSLSHAAAVLAADPMPSHDTSLPALSLSGGAANGAFVAGFLYALLWTREQARFHATPAQRALLDRERFGSAFGSSVGSLIGLPLDLYFTETAPAALGPALDACVKEGSGPPASRTDRRLQDCGLALLEHDFVANEWELLCARHGLALDLLSPNAKSLLRFDPLEHDRIDPFLRTFGTLTRDNTFLRSVVAADLGQGVLAAIDERSCRIPGMNADRCEREAILASVSEPVLAPPRARLYSGLDGPGGEEGAWVDGGLQSVNPAARAVAYTNGKVLALNTFRALGTPVAHFEGLTPIVLGTVTTLGTRMIGWETSYAGLEQHRRRAHACELGRLVGIAALCAEHESAVPGPMDAGPQLLSLSVPDDITPAELFASGFTFDPVVMRGLFLWGERLMLRGRADILHFLDWCVPATLEQDGVACPGGEGKSPAFAAAVRDLERRVTAEIDGYRKYQDPGVWKKHLEDRRNVVKKNLKTCEGD